MIDYLFPFVVFGCIVSLRKKYLEVIDYRLIRWFRVLTLIWFWVNIVPVILLMIFPPMWLAAMFKTTEIIGEKKVESVVSPGGWQTATVYHQPVGAYAPLNGHAIVKVHYRWLPLLERDVFYKGTSYLHDDDVGYVAWVNNREIRISETGEKIKVKSLEFRIPIAIVIPIVVVSYISCSEMGSPANVEDRNSPLIFPRYLNESKYLKFREDESFNVLVGYERFENESPSRIALWYLDIFKEHPWGIVQVNPIPRIEQSAMYYCFIIKREGFQKASLFYISIQGYSNNEDVVVRVSIGKPTPDHCYGFFKENDR